MTGSKLFARCTCSTCHDFLLSCKLTKRWKRESGFRKSRKSGLACGILYLGGLGIRNTVQEIQNPTKDWNPESKFP